MAPVRRYLRITKYSVLEVRIYLDNPAAQPWLLNPRDDVLSRIFQAIRPFVLPKLREEHERAKGSRSKRPKGVKDTVVEDDFEVAIFLTEQSTRHSLLTKQKKFHDKKGRIKSNSGKLTGWLEKDAGSAPIDVDQDTAPITIREESDDEAAMGLEDYPEATTSTTTTKSSGRKRRRVIDDQPIEIEDTISDDEGFQTQSMPGGGQGLGEDQNEPAPEDDDKKKLGLNTAYDGFSIYGRILCLVVKRKGVTNRATGASANQGGQQMLENWVSTQAAQETILEAD